MIKSLFCNHIVPQIRRTILFQYVILYNDPINILMRFKRLQMNYPSFSISSSLTISIGSNSSIITNQYVTKDPYLITVLHTSICMFLMQFPCSPFTFSALLHKPSQAIKHNTSIVALFENLQEYA